MNILLSLLEMIEKSDELEEVPLELSKQSTKGLYYRRSPFQQWQKCTDNHTWNSHFYYAKPKGNK